MKKKSIFEGKIITPETSDRVYRTIDSPSWTVTTTGREGYTINMPTVVSSGWDSKIWRKDIFTGDYTSELPLGELFKEELEKEGEFHMSHTVENEQAYDRKRHSVSCSDRKDLSQDHVLKCISVMKSKLMMACIPIRLENIECCMTPEVKKNIIAASKRLAMYGKEKPFVARFDDYGRRLPDEAKIETLKGMTIKIVEPDKYGELYLSFTGITCSSDMYYPREDYSPDMYSPF